MSLKIKEASMDIIQKDSRQPQCQLSTEEQEEASNSCSSPFQPITNSSLFLQNAISGDTKCRSTTPRRTCDGADNFASESFIFDEQEPSKPRQVIKAPLVKDPAYDRKYADDRTYNNDKNGAGFLQRQVAGATTGVGDIIQAAIYSSESRPVDEQCDILPTLISPVTKYQTRPNIMKKQHDTSHSLSEWRNQLRDLVVYLVTAPAQERTALELERLSLIRRICEIESIQALQRDRAKRGLFRALPILYGSGK